jgi:hypothetical protein
MVSDPRFSVGYMQKARSMPGLFSLAQNRPPARSTVLVTPDR